MDAEARGTGITYQPSSRTLTGKGEPVFDPRSGDHAWVMTAAWRVDPAAATTPAERVHLDQENLLLLAGPGCYFCEQEYTPLLANRRCKGRP